MLVDGAERLLASGSGVEAWRANRASPIGFDEERWAAMAGLGWLALAVPESAGGLGGSIEDVALLNIALGKALATEPLVSSAVLGAHLLAQAGEAQSGLLQAVIEGRERLALAHDEPGDDPVSAAVQTRCIARRTADGFHLDGVKTLVLDAPSATRLIVSARIEGENGCALLLVDPDCPGVAIDSYPLIDGTRAADVTLSSVQLPATALIAEGDGAAALLGEDISILIRLPLLAAFAAWSWFAVRRQLGAA